MSPEDLELRVLMHAERLRDAGRRLDLDEFAAEFPEADRDWLLKILVEHLGLDEAIRAAAPQAEPPPSLPPGRRLGEFELLAPIGHGGMGSVHRARQTSTGRAVAVKVLPPGLAGDRRRWERFQREIAALAALDHPHLVRLLTGGREDDCPWYAMDLVDGADLESVLRLLAGDESLPDDCAGAARACLDAARRSRGSRATDRDVLIGWCLEVARGLHHAHEVGIVHRDVKPSNVLLDLHGRARLADFGLARTAGEVTLLTAPGGAGTPAYMSPEQARGEGHWTTPATDVYSLGATLYHAICGRPPFPPDRPRSTRELALQTPPPPRRVARGLPRDLEAVILRAMDPDPRRRHPGAAALADDLEALLRGRPVRSRTAPVAVRATRWARLHPVPVLSAAVLAGMAGTGAWIRDGIRRGAELDRSVQALQATADHARTLLADGNAKEADATLRQAAMEAERLVRRSGRSRHRSEALLTAGRMAADFLQPDQAAQLFRLCGRAAERELLELEPARLGSPMGVLSAAARALRPERARLAGYFDRVRLLDEIPGAQLGGIRLADALDDEGRPGRDGRAEILLVDSELCVVAVAPDGRLSVLIEPPHCAFCEEHPEGFGTAGDSKLIVEFAPIPTATGAPAWITLSHGILRRHELAGGRLVETWRQDLREFGVPYWPDQPCDLHATLTALRHREALWIHVGPEAFGHDASAEWTGAFVRVAEPGDPPLCQADLGDPPDPQATIVFDGVACDPSGTGEEVFAAACGEWFGFGLRLYMCDPEAGASWRRRREVRLGRVDALVPCGPWLLAVKRDHPSEDLFDYRRPGGLTPGLYPLRVVAGPDGPDLELDARRADMRFPGFTPTAAVVARVGAPSVRTIFFLADRQGTRIVRQVLACYTADGPDSDCPDLSESREVFHFEPSAERKSAHQLIGAGQFDSDEEEEIVLLVSERLCILGWDGP